MARIPIFEELGMNLRTAIYSRLEKAERLFLRRLAEILIPDSRLESLGAGTIALPGRRAGLRPAPTESPAPCLQQILFFHLADVEALHRFAEFFGGFENRFRILVVRRGLDDGACPLGRVVGFEDAGPDEDRFGAELHHECSVR